jgi:sodium transport system permease protein
MNFRTTAAVYQKEMLEIFRDRRTLISMVLVPVAVIPLMFSVIGKFMESRGKQAEGEAVTVGILSEPRIPAIVAALRAAGLRLVEKPDLRAAVEKKDVAAALDEVEQPSGHKQIRIYIDRTRLASQIAGDRVRTAVDQLKSDMVRASLRSSGVPENVLTPFTVERVNVASEKKMSGMVIGSALGYVVILFMFMGALYPAIDMTAGEKERRTLEAILCSPASRDEIILGKIMAAATAAFITALLTLGSMARSFRMLAKAGSGDNSLQMTPPDMQALGLALLLVLPTAIVASSLMVGIALFAKSYKEAQSYLTPLVMLAAFPAVIGMLPGLELTPALALIPIFNVCQLMKEIFLGDFSRVAFAVACIANLVYAAIAYMIASRIFKSESVLFRV